ncbi:MAG: bacillithiol system redox-active protein YtxJ [Bryobacteraceae bacterium]
MPWSRSSQSLPEIDSIEDCANVMKEELVILFKHSPTCPVSWMAHREVLQYRSAQPDVPIYLISVRRRRDVSRYIAEQTGIQHESPQIIALRRGEVIGAGSHDDITAETLAAFVAGKSAEQIAGGGILGTREPASNPGS